MVEISAEVKLILCSVEACCQHQGSQSCIQCFPETLTTTVMRWREEDNYRGYVGRRDKLGDSCGSVPSSPPVGGNRWDASKINPVVRFAMIQVNCRAEEAGGGGGG